MSNTHTVNETLVQNKPYDLQRDFVAVAPINYSDLVLVAHPSMPASNVRELLQAAKEKPGKLNYASSGTGTPYHMAGELFKSMSDTKIVHIPYKGSSGARTDVLGGQVDLMFDAVTTMTEQIKAGKAKAIATTGSKRAALMPDVPTIAESGYQGYEALNWYGYLAPKGTPKDIVDRLHKEIARALANPKVIEQMNKTGVEPLSMTPDEFGAYIKREFDTWGKVVKQAGIKPQ